VIGALDAPRIRGATYGDGANKASILSIQLYNI
jgi:hypothetical protein